MSGFCNHAALNTHTRSGRADGTCGESSRRQSHVNTRVGDADMHVTVLAGKSMQSFGKGNMSLEGRRKAEKVTKCGGEGDVMCCMIGSEMWLCMRLKKQNERKSISALYIKLQFIIHFLPVSSGFRMDTHAFHSILRVVYALPTAQGTDHLV